MCSTDIEGKSVIADWFITNILQIYAFNIEICVYR